MDLEEEVYMVFLLEWRHQKLQVCAHKKSHYGLKQSQKAWFEKFSKVVKNTILASARPRLVLLLILITI